MWLRERVWTSLSHPSSFGLAVVVLPQTPGVVPLQPRPIVAIQLLSLGVIAGGFAFGGAEQALVLVDEYDVDIRRDGRELGFDSFEGGGD